MLMVSNNIILCIAPLKQYHSSQFSKAREVPKNLVTLDRRIASKYRIDSGNITQMHMDSTKRESGDGGSSACTGLKYYHNQYG